MEWALATWEVVLEEVCSNWKNHYIYSNFTLAVYFHTLLNSGINIYLLPRNGQLWRNEQRGPFWFFRNG